MKLSIATLLLTLIGLIGLIAAEGPAESLITDSYGTEEVEEYLQNVEMEDELYGTEGNELSDGEGLSDEPRKLRKKKKHHKKKHKKHKKKHKKHH